jgi:hypothetical protein
MGEVQRRLVAKLLARRETESFVPRERWIPTQQDLDRLKVELVSDANDLYNNLAFTYNAWEECLHILKHVGLNDENEVRTLWRQVMFAYYSFSCGWWFIFLFIVFFSFLFFRLFYSVCPARCPTVPLLSLTLCTSTLTI